MKKLAMALVLMCALSASSFAGNMPTGGYVPPPPPPPGETQLSETRSDRTQSSETQSIETESSLFATVLLTIISLI